MLGDICGIVLKGLGRKRQFCLFETCMLRLGLRRRRRLSSIFIITSLLQNPLSGKMNLCRLVRLKPYLNYRNFSSIVRSEFKPPHYTPNPFHLSSEDNHPHTHTAHVNPSAEVYAKNCYDISEGDSADKITENFIARNDMGIEVSPRKCGILLKSLTKEGRRIDFIIASQVCRICISKPWFKPFLEENPLLLNSLLGGVGISSFVEFKYLVEALQSQGLQPNVFFYEMVIQKTCHVGNPAEALEYFDMLSSTGIKFKSATYEDLFRKLGTETDLSVFARLYKDACVKNVQLQSDCFEIMTQVFIRKGDFQTASSVWDQYQHYKEKASNKKFHEFCSQTLYDLCDCGNVGEAKLLFDRMLSRDMTPNEHATQVLIISCCSFEKIEDATHIFGSIFRSSLYNVEANSSSWAECMHDVCCSIAEVGDSEIAKEAAEHLMTTDESENIPYMRKLICSFAGILDVPKEDPK